MPPTPFLILCFNRNFFYDFHREFADDVRIESSDFSVKVNVAEENLFIGWLYKFSCNKPGIIGILYVYGTVEVDVAHGKSADADFSAFGMTAKQATSLLFAKFMSSDMCSTI